MSEFYRRLDQRMIEERNARIFSGRPENLHEYQGCANDANLRAAAPQMYEALKAIDALFGEPLCCLLRKMASKGPITNGDQAIIDAAFIKMTAAIEKAEGRSTDAQGSVTEQSQQKSRQDGE